MKYALELTGEVPLPTYYNLRQTLCHPQPKALAAGKAQQKKSKRQNAALNPLGTGNV